MSRTPRLICLLLALLLLSGCAGRAPEPESAAAPTVLWLWSGLPMSASLPALAEEYSAAHPGSPVSVRVFENENALAAAMNEARPDLLLCTGERADALYAQDKLRPAEPDAALDAAFLALHESAGIGFFPLGAELPVLAVNAAGYLASPVTSGAGDAALGGTESLLSLAAAHGRSTEQPFFAAESWAAFFALYLGQAGESFSGERRALRESEQAAALYNLLAEAAFARGLYTGAEDAAALVRQGYVTSALLPSRALAGDTVGLVCYPAPLWEGCEPRLPATCWGLAVTAESGTLQPGAEDFLRWLLEPERAAALALDAGLLPAAAGWSAGGEEGTLEAALLSSKARGALVPAASDEPWRAHAEDFDAALRGALDLLD